MQIFDRFQLGTKIIAGYMIALALMIIVGTIALLRINEIDNTVTNLADNLARDQRLADEMVAQTLLARFYANKYIQNQDSADIERFNNERQKFETLLDIADIEITKPERVALLTGIKTDVAAYNNTFIEIIGLINNRQQKTADVLDAYGLLAENEFQTLRVNTFMLQNVFISAHTADAQTSFLLMRFNVSKYLLSGDPMWIDAYEEQYVNVQENLENLKSELKNQGFDQMMQTAKDATESYDDGFRSIQVVYSQQEALQNQLDELGSAIQNTASEMSENVAVDFAVAKQQSTKLVTQTRIIIIGVMGLAIIIGLGLGIAITRGITIPLKKVTEMSQQIADVDLQALTVEMDALAQGDLTRSLSIRAMPLDITSKDEIGQMANAFNAIIRRLHRTGDSFEQMITNLNQLIGNVSDAANGVGSTANELTGISAQASQAATQVAETIQQVAQGTSQQAESMNRATSTIEQISQAIDGVAQGAQEQATATANSLRTSQNMTTTIEQVATTAQSGAVDSAKAAEAARTGAKTIEQTITGMQSIKAKVDLSAQKVQEMGFHSDQIGAIVETIDDIASQTNLLALNAAIEAARAGEHGKGFAVVADEVRKLAEKSAAATREISQLIKGIQQTVSDAVSAMNEGATEVEAGVAQASQAGQALDNILRSVEKVNLQVNGIAEAALIMSSSSDNLVSAMDTVSAVVEENTAATEEMAAGSTEMMTAVENVASITQENSAAVQEVNAAAEEMHAQVEEVTASAQTLSKMAQSLQDIVVQFRIKSDNTVQKPKENQSPKDTPKPQKLPEKQAKASPESVKIVTKPVPIQSPKPKPADPQPQQLARFKWDNSLSTGSDAIDEHHKQLIKYINELMQALSKGKGKEQIGKTLDNLGDYVMMHFEAEEALMAQYDSPVAEVNRQAHARFVMTFDGIWEKYHSNGASTGLVLEIKKELGDWLINHIQKIDTRLHSSIEKAGEKNSRN